MCRNLALASRHPVLCLLPENQTQIYFQIFKDADLNLIINRDVMKITIIIINSRIVG